METGSSGFALFHLLRRPYRRLCHRRRHASAVAANLVLRTCLILLRALEASRPHPFSPSSRSRRARREQSSLPVPLRPSSAAPPPFHAPRAAQELIRPVLNIHCPVPSSISPSLGRNRARHRRIPLTLARASVPLTDDQPPLLLDSIQGSGGIPLALLDLPDPFPLWFVRHRRRERLSPPCAAACSSPATLEQAPVLLPRARALPSSVDRVLALPCRRRAPHRRERRRRAAALSRALLCSRRRLGAV